MQLLLSSSLNAEEGKIKDSLVICSRKEIVYGVTIVRDLLVLFLTGRGTGKIISHLWNVIFKLEHCTEIMYARL